MGQALAHFLVSAELGPKKQTSHRPRRGTAMPEGCLGKAQHMRGPSHALCSLSTPAGRVRWVRGGPALPGWATNLRLGVRPGVRSALWAGRQAERGVALRT